MGNRLSKIYTRTGDQGTTGLGDGTRRDKDDLRIEAIGTVDELNSQLGVLLSDALPEKVYALLQGVQHDLFDLGGELAVPGYSAIGDGHVARLETALDEFNQTLPPLKEFILPGGNRQAALCHVARAVCRRAERVLVSLRKQEETAPALMRYVNRLSDLLFVLARTLNRDVSIGGTGDVLWQPGKNRDADTSGS